MTSDAVAQPNAKTFTPEDIVAEVLAGRVRVPSFQRKFRWRAEEVQNLFDSIAKGYPIGNLLLWERAAPEEHIRIGALAIEAPQTTALFVVDGQQRVTSLANVLTESGAAAPPFSLAFDLEKQTFKAFDRGADLSTTLIPLHVIFDLQRLLQWFAERPDQKNFLSRATRIAKAIRQYAIPAYVVKQQEEAVLRDIFDRMNNYGKRLSRAEIFSALHGAEHRGANIHFSDITEAIDASTGFGQLDEDTALRAILARRSPDIRRDVRIEFNEGSVQRDFDETRDSAYQEGQIALERAVQFLQAEAGVPHFGFLPYRYLVVVLTRFFAHYPKPSSRIQTLLRRFFWRAALAGPNIFRGSWTGAMAALAAAIKPNDQTGSIDRLLKPFQAQKFAVPSLRAFRTRNADGRVILCALWSLRPLSPVDGSEYNLDNLRKTLDGEITPSNAVRLFFPRAPGDSRLWASNRAILLDEVEVDGREAFDSLSGFSASVRSKILTSHALDRSMLKLLKADDDKAFLEARRERLAGVVRGFVERMTESKFEDTPPLDDLELDEDGERDDPLG